MENLPVAMNCDNKDLLRDMARHSDHLLFTWTAWVSPDLEQGLLVDLRERLRPKVPDLAFQLPCAIVRLADRTPSPLAKVLIRMIERKAAGQR